MYIFMETGCACFDSTTIVGHRLHQLMKRQLMKVRLTFHPSNTLTSANVLSASLHEGRTDSCIGAECWQCCQVLYQPVSA